MRIGISFDLKCDDSEFDLTAPDDAQEEFDSPVTIEAIASVLRDLGHDVSLLGGGQALVQHLLADPPDFVFNLSEGRGVSRSREARVPALLEMLRIPFSGSDPLTLAVTLDKTCAKRLAASAGVAVPWGAELGPGDDVSDLPPNVAYPVIVKPAWEGSSKGIRRASVVHDGDELARIVAQLRHDYRQPLVVEEFVRGDELTVGMIGNDPPRGLAVMRVLPKQPARYFVYSLEVKRDFRRLVDYEVPAKLNAVDTETVVRAAHAVFRVLGCRDVCRIDFRLRDGVPYFLEANPLPGLKPHDSDLVIMADLAGWTYPKLIESILAAALERLQAAPTKQPAKVRGWVARANP